VLGEKVNYLMLGLKEIFESISSAVNRINEPKVALFYMLKSVVSEKPLEAISKIVLRSHGELYEEIFRLKHITSHH